ncbi:MAG: ABC transporter substrate-binding protein [Clostridia bacterium]|nr:ABC transporter substrate-binding protein [Clostridia bacterium]
MRKLCNFLCLCLSLCLLAACSPKNDTPSASHTFTDSAGYTVTVSKPQRVAVLFSSLADIWVSAGGSLAVTVGETVERGLASADTVLVDAGAGKTIDREALIAAAPDLVITSADIEAQRECAAFLRENGITVAEFRVECFADYLNVLKICTELTGRPDLYEALGTAQQTRIDALLAEKPLSGKRILFIRAGSSARSVKAKGSTDHFAAAMLTELGAVNIADAAPLLLDGLAMEVILAENPDYIFFTAMGDEEASKAYVTQMLQNAEWQSLSAVQKAKWSYLPKNLFHYKPCGAWADAYDHLANEVAALNADQ